MARPEGEEKGVGAQLVAMPNCAPPHIWTGAQERWGLGEGDYLDILDETARQVAIGKRGAMSPASLPMLH